VHSTVIASSEPPTDDPEVPVDGRAARWHGHKANRRADLANEARKAIHRLGPEASMDDLATALGTSKSILYRYFSDKTGLQHAVGEVVVTRMLTALVEASHRSVTPRENLRAVIGVYLEMVEASPAVYSFVTQVQTGPPPTGGGSPLRSFLDAVSLRVVAPIAESLLRDHPGGGTRNERALEQLAQTWACGAVGFVRGAGDRWLAASAVDRPLDLPALTDEVTAWLWTGVTGLTRTIDVAFTEPSAPSVVIDVEVGHGHPQERP
jgi:AcrR family transcriptional regulator